MTPRWHSGKESVCQCRRCKRHGFSPWVGMIPGEGNGNPLWYSFLGKPMDRGVCWATVHGVSKSWTQLNDWAHTHTHWNLIGIVALIWPKENLLFIWLMQKKKSVSLAIARYKYATCPHLSPWLYKPRGSWTLSINLQLKMSALLSYFQDIIEICPILFISMTITPTRVTVSLSPRPLQ